MSGHGRRTFLGRLGAVGAALVLPAGGTRGGEALGQLDEAYTFLTGPEAEFVEAAVARLIPGDDASPGALEAGVPWFIDQQLAGAWGAGARLYLQGPFGDATPEQGYQLPLTPQQLFRTAIADVAAWCASAHGKAFAALGPTDQDAVLARLEAGDLPLAHVPARAFFDVLLAVTRQGLFADPMYGGNRGKAGWKLIGFPGVGASYAALVERHGVPYDVEPVGIADVKRGRVATDAHGHPVHPAKAK
jgi:gluconate 2-dehydrogenase gamma chain